MLILRKFFVRLTVLPLQGFEVNRLIFSKTLRLAEAGRVLGQIIVTFRTEAYVGLFLRQLCFLFQRLLSLRNCLTVQTIYL